MVNFVVGLLELLIGVRFVLKLIGAGPAPFVTWIYETTQPLVSPFIGILPNPVLSGGLRIEFASLVSLLVYSLIAYLIGEFVETIYYNARRRASD